MDDFSQMINALNDGFVKTIGARCIKATLEEVIYEMDVGPQHLQPLGVVHGGVHSALIETVASVGAAIDTMRRGQVVVGLENHTSFLHAVRSGTLRATGRALTRGKRTHVWEVAVTDANGRTVSSGRVRLIVLDQDQSLAGEAAALKNPR
jgi:uncharacterized protein (TIGR00369 family)